MAGDGARNVGGNGQLLGYLQMTTNKVDQGDTKEVQGYAAYNKPKSTYALNVRLGCP